MTLPTVNKCAKVRGKNLVLRNIEEDDAEFVLQLRLDPIKSKFLTGTSSNLQDQKNWIAAYNRKQGQAYFVICDNSERRLGCIRMYDPIERSYCWGSWLMIAGLSPLVAIESALLVYSYGKCLGFEDVRIHVHSENRYVWSFHEKFAGAELVDANDTERFYVVKKERVDGLLHKYSNLLPNPLIIESI
jgi:hypothetical protein